MWLSVVEPGSNPPRLLFKYDPERNLVEIQRRGEKHTIDLERLKQEAKEKAGAR